MERQELNVLNKINDKRGSTLQLAFGGGHIAMEDSKEEQGHLKRKGQLKATELTE